MSITVTEHQKEARQVHQRGQEIAGVLEELKDVVEKSLETAKDQDLKEKILNWANLHGLKLHRTVDIRHFILNARKVIEDFESQIPKVIEEFGFRFNDEPISFYGQTSYYDGPNGAANIGKDFLERIKQTFNPFKEILDEIESDLEVIDYIIQQLNGTDIDYSNKGLVQMYLNSLKATLENLERNFFSLFLGDKSLYLGLHNLRNVDSDRYVKHRIMSLSYHSEGIEGSKSAIDSYIYASLPILNKVKGFIFRQLPENYLVLDLNDEKYKGTRELLISRISSYLIAKFQKQKEMIILINLYKHLSSLTNSLRNSPIDEITSNEIGEVNIEGPITKLSNLIKSKELTQARVIVETIDPFLAIQRLTLEIVELIEQITKKGKLPPEIEKTLQTKADGVKLEKQLEEERKFASVDQ